MIYREVDDTVPFVDWFSETTDHARDKVLVRIERLRELGHELRRPEADFLRDGGELKMARKPTTDALEILHRRFYKSHPEKLTSLAECRANDEIARKIRILRMKAGLTQAQLAKLVGTTASVIFRLEDAGYEGHSIAMLRRIAAALNRRVEIRFLPISQSA